MPPAILTVTDRGDGFPLIPCNADLAAASKLWTTKRFTDSYDLCTVIASTPSIFSTLDDHEKSSLERIRSSCLQLAPQQFLVPSRFPNAIALLKKLIQHLEDARLLCFIRELNFNPDDEMDVAEDLIAGICNAEEKDKKQAEEDAVVLMAYHYACQLKSIEKAREDAVRKREEEVLAGERMDETPDFEDTEEEEEGESKDEE